MSMVAWVGHNSQKAHLHRCAKTPSCFFFVFFFLVFLPENLWEFFLFLKGLPFGTQGSEDRNHRKADTSSFLQILIKTFKDFLSFTQRYYAVSVSVWLRFREENFRFLPEIFSNCVFEAMFSPCGFVLLGVRVFVRCMCQFFFYSRTRIFKMPFTFYSDSYVFVSS